jgi:hypothetical protein
MRKNAEQVIEKFFAGKATARNRTISTDGKVIYSYTTPIASIDSFNEGGYVVTKETYSRTTTCQTHAIRYSISKLGKNFREVSEDELYRIKHDFLDKC